MTKNRNFKYLNYINPEKDFLISFRDFFDEATFLEDHFRELCQVYKEEQGFLNNHKQQMTQLRCDLDKLLYMLRKVHDSEPFFDLQCEYRHKKFEERLSGKDVKEGEAA